MDKKKINIMFAAIAGLLALAVTFQGLRINSLKKEVKIQESKVQIFSEALERSEAENARMRELVSRANQALERTLNQVEKAKEQNDDRKDKIDDAPADWLMCPLPDEVREALGDYCYSDSGDKASDGASVAM